MSSRRVAKRVARRTFQSPRDRQIFLRQMQQESGFSDVTSPAGAQGPAQIMPGTAAAWGVKNAHDPREAYTAAATHMADYLKQYGGSWAKALTAYNAGPGAVGGSLPAETRNYIQKILGGADAKAGRTTDSTGHLRVPRDPKVTLDKVTVGRQETFDQQGFEQAQRRALVAQMLQRNDPNSFLAKMLGSAPPSPADFTTSRLTSSTTPGKLTVPTMPQGGGRKTLVIGDSLGVGTVPFLKRAVGGKVDADVKVGRSSANGIQALHRKLQGGNYGRIVLDLGTNDATPGELAASITHAKRMAKGAQIYIPTVNGPDAERKNRVIRRMAGGNVHVVDWNSPLADGIHPTGQGYRTRAQALAAAFGGGGRAKGRLKGTVVESFYNGPGGANTDEGRRVGKGYVSGHTDHVHYAAKTHAEADAIGRIAQNRFGLTVRELEPFDKVDPVHVQGSFHYRGLAGDVSGDPAQMAAFSRWLAKRRGR